MSDCIEAVDLRILGGSQVKVGYRGVGATNPAGSFGVNNL